MVSASISVEDHSGGTGPDTSLSTKGPILMDADLVRNVQFKEQFTARDDYAPKVRKPYTITKQRERWTEEEHKKFLEALKLYGRAWRRIEEHVGTKTAVQIRSHAQKFFSKVVRESNCSDASSVKPIEIPPPRPKRKPAHPYPRKLVNPVKVGVPASEKSMRSGSPNFSALDHENRSPKSVLSAVGSDGLGVSGSNASSPEGSQSPVSSGVGNAACSFAVSESCAPLLEEDHQSSSHAQGGANGNDIEQACLRLELFSHDERIDLLGPSPVHCLKLFGKTVIVTESCQPRSPATEICGTVQAGTENGSLFKTLARNLASVESSLADSEFCAPSSSSFSGSVVNPCIQVHNPVPVRPRPSCGGKSTEDKEIKKEGCSTGLNAESATMKRDGDTFSGRESGTTSMQMEKRTAALKPMESASLLQRDGSARSRLGFVPYKRSLAEREVQSLAFKGEEREAQRVRLCL